MSSRPVHDQFTQQVGKPTARCDGCNEKAHKVLNRCLQCVQWYCNSCLDGGVGSHHRSPNDASQIPSGAVQLAPSATPARKKRKLDISTSLDETTGQNSDGSPKKKFATPKTMGTFHPSPQHVHLHGSRLGKPVGSPLRQGQFGLSTTEFDDVLSKPWNKRSILGSYVLGSNSSSSDMESDDDIDKHHMKVSNVPDSLQRDLWKATTSKVSMGVNGHQTVQQGQNGAQSKDQDPIIDTHAPVHKSRGAAAAQRLRSALGTQRVKKVVKEANLAKRQVTKAKKAPSKPALVSEIDIEGSSDDDGPDDPRTLMPTWPEAKFNGYLVHEQVMPEAKQDVAVPTYASERTKRLFAMGSRYRYDGANLDLLVMASAQLK